MSKDRKERIIELIYYVVLMGISVILIRKCRLGFANIDESFYLTVPKRLLQGDRLLLHEWNLAQFSGIMLMPLMKFLGMLHFNHVGIILLFRYTYVLVQFVLALFIYSVLRRYSVAGAMIASVLVYMYAPYGIMALSYNTMPLIFISLSMLLLFCLDGKGGAFFSGVSFAFAVLAAPYLAFLYVYLLVVCLIMNRSNQKHHYNATRLLLFTGGGATVAAGLLIWLLTSVGFHKLSKTVTYVLQGDPEHSGDQNFNLKLYRYVFEFLHSNSFNIFGLLILISLCAIGLVARKKTVQCTVVALACIETIIHLYQVIVVNHYINMLMIPINMLGGFFLVLYWKKQDIELLWGVYLPGLLYSFITHFQSNQGINSMANAGAIMIIASAVFIIKGLKYTFESCSSRMQIMIGLMGASLFIVQTCSLLYFRYEQIFWEDGPRYQTELMTEGPEAGLLVTKEKSDIYTMYYNDIHQNISDEEQVLFLSEKTWLYLCGNYGNASFSAWLTEHPENVIRRLDEYYSLNPDKNPSVIFLDREHADLSFYCNQMGFALDYTCESGNQIYRRGTP